MPEKPATGDLIATRSRSWWSRLLRRARFWTATEGDLERAVGAGEPGQPPGRRYFGLKWTWKW